MGIPISSKSKGSKASPGQMILLGIVRLTVPTVCGMPTLKYITSYKGKTFNYMKNNMFKKEIGEQETNTLNKNLKREK